MAYTFINWNSYIDPLGVSRILDWTDTGILGKFPSVYIEALRQAALERLDVLETPEYINPIPLLISATAPEERTSSYGIDGVFTLLEFIDKVAWLEAYYPGYSGYVDKWIDPQNFADISGRTDYSDVPGVMGTEADILEAIGQPTRIPFSPENIYGGISGAYLRQLKDVFMAKRYFRAYSYTNIYNLERRSGEGRTWDLAAAAFSSASWNSVFLDTLGWRTRAQMIYMNVNRVIIERVRGLLYWGIRGSNGCTHSTCYIYNSIPLDTYTFLNPDYPTLPENIWVKYHDDESLSYNFSEVFCDFDNSGTNPIPSLLSNPSYNKWFYWGYAPKWFFTVCDYRDDFTLGI